LPSSFKNVSMSILRPKRVRSLPPKAAPTIELRA
jgi:hypothetical protein